MEKLITSVGALLTWPRAEEKHNRGSYESPQKDREQRHIGGTLPAFVFQPRFGDDGPGN